MFDNFFLPLFLSFPAVKHEKTLTFHPIPRPAVKKEEVEKRFIAITEDYLHINNLKVNLSIDRSIDPSIYLTSFFLFTVTPLEHEVHRGR